MKIFSWEKDGGVHSTVHGLYVVEIKKLFSIVLLRFDGASREAYHSHAFNCFSWVLKGRMIEDHRDGSCNLLPPSGRSRLIPFNTYRDTFHKVSSKGVSWVLSFRGPWSRTWDEYLEIEDRDRILTSGRIEV